MMQDSELLSAYVGARGYLYGDVCGRNVVVWIGWNDGNLNRRCSLRIPMIPTVSVDNDRFSFPCMRRRVWRQYGLVVDSSLHCREVDCHHAVDARSILTNKQSPHLTQKSSFIPI